jgi:hypothetical protein
MKSSKLVFSFRAFQQKYLNSKSPGADVMITIFGDFQRKKWCFSQKNNVMIKF